MALWRPQKDGSTYQWVNCSLVSWGRVMKAAFARFGKVPPTGLASWNSTITKLSLGWSSTRPTMAEAMRSWIRTHVGAGYTGGITIPMSMKAGAALWGSGGLGFGYRWNVPFETLWTYLTAGRPIHVIIDYDVVHGTPFDASPLFNDRHSIAIEKRRLYRWTDSAGVVHSREEGLVHDPMADHRRSGIPQGPQWWPMTLIRHGATKSMGSTVNVEFGFGPDLTP